MLLTTTIDPIAKLLGEWSYTICGWSLLLRIFLAVLFGALLGLERSVKRHSAGLRTFIFITLASTISMIIDQYLIGTYSFKLPLLSCASIIGSSIIVANTMLYTSRSQIKGLTTSVGLWCAGILGLTIGYGLYTLSIIAFITIMLCLSVLPNLEVYLKNRSNHFELNLQLKNASYLKEFVTTIKELGLKIDELEANPAYNGSGISAYSISVSIVSDELKKYKTHKEIIQALSSLDYVFSIEEM